ncbi:four-carbon acid sugar kinase family protein [Nonomuraea sp. NPDC050404]|uniref:four-carbon acid sugar kinase family protein n=1 Tax=Nonomuraea sp. NPDC050404 TaxID=3155783 RepID=UPI0033D111F0
MFALADDLSGAAETAAALMTSARSARIALSGPPYPSDPHVLVADLDSRHHPRAAELVREALAHAAGRRVFVKVDSLLRGGVAATVAACLDAPVVFAPALPVAGRTVVGGVPYIKGIPLRETRMWHAESRPAPASVAEALRGVPVAQVPLATVRAGREVLAETLRRAGAGGRVAVCDAETDGDLDLVAAGALAAGPGTRLIGAGGLATALGRTLPAGKAAQKAAQKAAPKAAGKAPGNVVAREAASPDTPLLVVVGTAHPGATAQAELLSEHGARLLPLDTNALNAQETTAHRVRDALTTAPTVLTVAGAADPATLTTILGAIVARALADRPAHLVLTGGETARRVLDALGVRELTPIGQVHHGAVHCRTPLGHSVVTRPGSFGDRDSLLRIAAHLSPESFRSEERLT